MGAWNGFGVDILKGAINGMLGLGFGTVQGAINNAMTGQLNERTAELQNRYWNLQNDKLYAQSEKSAEKAMQRTIDMYNLLQSPSAIVKQLKEAGLNPALMYSGSGMGGQVTQGPQAETQGGQMPTALGLQNFVDPLTFAQIQNINADTDKKEEETKNISQDTALKQATEEYTKAQTLWTQIRTDIDKNNLTISSATIQEQITEIKTKTASALEELERQKRNNEIDEELYETKIKQVKQDYANSVSQGLIMEQEIEKLKAITENTQWDTKKKQEEIKKIKWECKVAQQEIFNLINDTNLKRVQAMTEQEQQNYLKTLGENITKEFEAKYGWTFTKEDAFRMGEEMVNIISTICGISSGSAVIGAIATKKPPVGFKP